MRRVSIGILALALAIGFGMGCATDKKADTSGTQATFKCAHAGCAKTKTAPSDAPAPS